MTEAERKRRYPARYYAIYNPNINKPVQVTGWMDVWDMEYSDSEVPPLEDLYPLTEEQWNWHLQQGNSQAQINQDGSISRYVSPPVPPPTLKKRAQYALDEIEDEAALVVAMGETFGPKTRQYVRQLLSIINGEDDSIKELPVKPTNLTD